MTAPLHIGKKSKGNKKDKKKNKKIYKVVKKLPLFDLNYPVVVDIESEKLHIGLVCVQVYQPQTSKKVYILTQQQLGEDKLKEEAKKLNDYSLIAHYGVYDYNFLELNPKYTHDTKYLIRLRYPEWNNLKLGKVKPYSLEHSTKKLLGDVYRKYGIDKDNIRTRFKQNEELTHEELTYGALDCINTYKIFKALKKERKDSLYDMNCKVLKATLSLTRNRLTVDRLKLKEELKKVEKAIAKNEKILNGLNSNSPAKVLLAMGKDTGKTQVKKVKRTKNGVSRMVDIEFNVYKAKGYEFTNTDKAVLLELIGRGKKLAKAVYDQRRLIKARTYLLQYDSNPINEDISECVSFFDPMGAYTGRFSSSGGDIEHGINAQQISRNYQYLFTVPHKDDNGNKWSYVHADYSTAELLAGSSIMNIKKMANMIKQGKDLHIYMASIVNNIAEHEVSKAQRQEAKAINFGLIFGMGLTTFIEYAYSNFGVRFTQEEAKKIIDLFFKTYPEAKMYHRNMYDITRKKQIIYTPLGLAGQPQRGNDGINFGTQGAVSDATKLSLLKLIDDHPEALNYIVNVIHDAIELKVPAGQEKKWAKRLAKAMNYGWIELMKSKAMLIKLPMKIEVELKRYKKKDLVINYYKGKKVA